MLAHHGTWRGKTIVSRATFDRTIAVRQTAPNLSAPYSCGAWIYAGSAFFQLKRDWHASCDALQGTPPTVFGH